MSTQAKQITLAALLTVAFGLAQQPAIDTMKDRGTGVIAFEVLRTSDKAEEALAEYGDEGRDAARRQLLIDYGFLLSYGALLWLLARAVASRPAQRAAIAGAAFDAIENAALLRIAANHPDQPFPAIAFTAATLKFAILAAAIVLIVVAKIRRRNG